MTILKHTNSILEKYNEYIKKIDNKIESYKEHLNILNSINKRYIKFKKIKLIKNSKKPMLKWKDKITKLPIRKNLYSIIDYEHNNVGILTGHINNIIVLDVDVSDNGLKTFEEFEKEYGKINTFKVATPSGGYHLYFNYKSKNPDTNYAIENILRNTSRIIKKENIKIGLDIRSDWGYVVSPSSSINNIYYKIVNYSKIIDMPDVLVNYLVINHTKNKIKKIYEQTEINRNINNTNENYYYTISDYDYIITDEQIINILNLLPYNYKDDYDEWLLVSTILKTHNKYNIWNNWSNLSTKYNMNDNNYKWNYFRTDLIDINYLVWILQKSGNKINYIEKIKNISLLNTNYKNITTYIEANEKYISSILSYDDFLNKDIIIIESCCGTAKTTYTCDIIDKHIKNNNKFKFITITTRQTLCDEHYKTFKKIGMQDYRDLTTDINDVQYLTICLNSLYKLNIDDDTEHDYILYLDEITAFTKFTHNETLEKKFYNTIFVLYELIKRAKKIIICDAKINDAVFILLRQRELNKNNCLFLRNNYKKFEGIEAIKVNNEKIFEDKISEHCQNNKPFIFACDKNDTTTKWHNKALKLDIETNANKYILLTADTMPYYRKMLGINRNWSEFLKNKYVFYSPSITFGVDLSYDKAQSVFVYITGCSITSDDIFQQTCRIRNIEKVYYYSNAPCHKAEYRSIEQLKEYYITYIKNNNNIDKYNGYVYYLTEDNDIKLINNNFSQLYFYQEYLIDTYKTNILKHYEKILEENGFILKIDDTYDEHKKINYTELNQITQDIKEAEFDEYINNDNKYNIKYTNINNNIDLLNLRKYSIDILIKYKNIIINRKKLLNYFNLNKLFYSYETLINEKESINCNAPEEATHKNLINKIIYIRDLENYYNIEPLDINFTYDEDKFKILDYEFFNNIKHIFRLTKSLPKNYDDVKQLYITLLRHVCNDIIISKRIKKGDFRDKYEYSIDEKYILFNLELKQLNKKNFCNYHKDIIKKYNLSIMNNNIDIFLDEY
jgi:hypothetical protein